MLGCVAFSNSSNSNVICHSVSQEMKLCKVCIAYQLGLHPYSFHTQCMAGCCFTGVCAAPPPAVCAPAVDADQIFCSKTGNLQMAIRVVQLLHQEAGRTHAIFYV